MELLPSRYELLISKACYVFQFLLKNYLLGLMRLLITNKSNPKPFNVTNLFLKWLRMNKDHQQLKYINC